MRDENELSRGSSPLKVPQFSPLPASAMTLESVRNTRPFRTARTALTERLPCGGQLHATCRPGDRSHYIRTSLTLWWRIRTIRTTCVIHSSQGLQLCCSCLSSYSSRMYACLQRQVRLTTCNPLKRSRMRSYHRHSCNWRSWSDQVCPLSAWTWKLSDEHLCSFVIPGEHGAIRCR